MKMELFIGLEPTQSRYYFQNMLNAFQVIKRLYCFNLSSEFSILLQLIVKYFFMVKIEVSLFLPIFASLFIYDLFVVVKLTATI